MLIGNTTPTRLCSLGYSRLSASKMKLKLEPRPPAPWALFQPLFPMLRCRASSLPLSSVLLPPIGSLDVSALAPSWLELMLDPTPRRSVSERSSLSYARKILLWLEELALLSLDNSLHVSRSNTYSKRFFQSSDNSLKMSKIPLESCASNHWSQWLNILPKKKIKFILSEHF